MKKTLLFVVLAGVLVFAMAACGGEAPEPQIIEREVEVIVEKEVVKEVSVEVVVEKEVVREVKIPGETNVVEKIIEVDAPTTYGESPQLAAMVSAGQLPPVEERLPENPMVIPVFRSIGKYGGTLRRGFLGPGDVGCNVGRVNGVMATRWTTDGFNVTPFVAESWESSPDGMSWTFHLRKGLKWSDGQPMTADDWVYALEDYFKNSDIRSVPPWARGPGAEPANSEKVDDYTIKYTYDAPFLTLPSVFAGHACMSSSYPFAPSHYMKQFHMDYNADAEKNAKAADFEGWVQYYINSYDVRDNIERPQVTPWLMQNTRAEEVIRTTRNPYYFAVDPEGNQLPYIDEWRFGLVANPEVLMLQAIQGEVDFQARHMSITNFPVLKENEEKSGFRMLPIPGFGGNDAMFNMNVTYDGPEREVIENRDFRIGLSHAIDRDFVNKVSFLDLGLPGNYLPPPGHPQHPGSEYETKNATYDVALANEYLDKAVPNKDGEGFRTMPNGDRLEIVISGTAAFGPWPDIAETVADFWGKVGVRTRTDIVERSLLSNRNDANEVMAFLWGPGRAVNLFVQSPWVNCEVDCPWGRAYVLWHRSGGTEGEEPPPDVKRLTELVNQGKGLPPDQANPLAQEVYKYIIDNQVIIGTARRSPLVMGVTVVNAQLENVPESWANDTMFNTPFPAYPEQFYYR